MKRRPACLVLLLIPLLAFCSACRRMEPEKITRVTFEAGDSFTGYPVCDRQGNQLDIGALPGETRLILYLSATCGDCRAKFDAYADFIQNLPSDGPGAAFLWQTDFPQKEELPQAEAYSYAVDGSLRLGEWVPTYFLINAEDTVLLRTTDFDEALEALDSLKDERQGIGFSAPTGDLPQ